MRMHYHFTGASKALHRAGKAWCDTLQQRGETRDHCLAASSRHLTALISLANVSPSSLVYGAEATAMGSCFKQSPHMSSHWLQQEEDGVKERWEEGSWWCPIHHVGPPEECRLPSVHLLDSMFILC